MLKRLIGLLIGVVMGVVVAVVVVLVLLDSDESDVLAVGVEFHPFTSSPGSGSCVPFAHTDPGPPNSCDPINLLFVGLTLEAVAASLTGSGWMTIGLGATQWLFFEADDTLQPNNLQLFRLDGIDRRFHMRLWGSVDEDGRPVVIGAVHHEQGIISHSIDRDWESAEERAVCGGSALTCRSTAPIREQRAIQGNDTEWRGWTNDGKPTVISASGPGQRPR